MWSPKELHVVGAIGGFDRRNITTSGVKLVALHHALAMKSTDD